MNKQYSVMNANNNIYKYLLMEIYSYLFKEVELFEGYTEICNINYADIHLF